MSAGYARFYFTVAVRLPVGETIEAFDGVKMESQYTVVDAIELLGSGKFQWRIIGISFSIWIEADRVPYTLMSFLGSIGKLMAGSGLEEVFEEVYAEHTIVHMFSGKAVAKSLRAHMLVQGALVSHLINALVDESKIDPLQLESVYKKAIMTGLKKDELIEFGDGDVFSHIEKMISEYTLTKKDASRTAKLWLLYMNYVSIVKEFLIAERTSNWCLHIQAVTKMMNLCIYASMPKALEFMFKRF
ncbi:hypothetical protein GQR58_009236 [Nymphon striatum]|nr:hypothetical protein GQR58_009236 [Nymphon striatum]